MTLTCAATYRKLFHTKEYYSALELQQHQHHQLCLLLLQVNQELLYQQ